LRIKKGRSIMYKEVLFHVLANFECSNRIMVSQIRIDIMELQRSELMLSVLLWEDRLRLMFSVLLWEGR